MDFQEGAPKDRFVITNTSACEIGALSVSIDLSTAPAGLIFDTTADGAGVEVFQPLELDQNDGTLRTTRKVVDGDQVLDLEIAALPAGARVSFTIDLDDTATDSALGQIRVSDAEISGAQVVMRMGDTTLRGVFAQSATAVVPLPTCTS